MLRTKKVELSEGLTVEDGTVPKLKVDPYNNCLLCNPKGLKIQLHETHIVVEGSRRVSISDEVIWKGTYDPDKPESFKFRATLWHRNIVKGRYPRLISGEHNVKLRGGNLRKELMEDFGDDVERARALADDVIALRKDSKVQEHFDMARIRRSRLS